MSTRQHQRLIAGGFWCLSAAIVIPMIAAGCAQSEPTVAADDPVGGSKAVVTKSQAGEPAASPASTGGAGEFEPGAIREAARERAAKAAENLSPKQRRYLNRLGQPDSFSIIFSHDDPADPRRLLRIEVWQYYDADIYTSTMRMASRSDCTASWLRTRNRSCRT